MYKFFTATQVPAKGYRPAHVDYTLHRSKITASVTAFFRRRVYGNCLLDKVQYVSL